MTFLNIALASVALVCMINLYRRYVIGKYMERYIFLTIGSCVLVIFTQTHGLVMPAADWKLKIVTIFWNCKTLLFAWAYRFSCLKK